MVVSLCLCLSLSQVTSLGRRGGGGHTHTCAHAYLLTVKVSLATLRCSMMSPSTIKTLQFFMVIQLHLTYTSAFSDDTLAYGTSLCKLHVPLETAAKAPVAHIWLIN